MASLIQRPGYSAFYIQYMVSGKAKRVSTGTESLQIAKEKLRQFDSANRINWGNYDLVVIDESHNFRNNDVFKDRETRYQRLLNSVIRQGVPAFHSAQS